MSEPVLIRIAPPSDPVADKARALRALGLPPDATDIAFLRAVGRSRLVPAEVRTICRRTARELARKAVADVG